MGLTYHHLDDVTRRLMMEEFERDIAAYTVYPSKRLTASGLTAWPDLVREAIRTGNDETLALSLRRGAYMKAREQARKPSGGYYDKDVPWDAPDTLAEGEFNRLYLRGLCRRAIDEGQPLLVIFRAKDVQHARSASQAKIGTTVEPHSLLTDLRSHPGVDTALGLPNGPNSGLSARFPS
jgi:hypothetical protein